MQITEKQLREQYERTKQLGWLDGVDLAGQRYDIKSAALLGIASRETNLLPRFLAEPGDSGHGWGLLQFDIRSYPDFVKSGAWRNADTCFEFAARKLASEFKFLQSWAGDMLVVRFSTGEKRKFKCAAFDKDKAWEVVVAGYNSGILAAAYHASAGRSPDTGTTGKNYSADIFYRARIFAKFLASDHAAATAPANTPTAPINPKGGQTNEKLTQNGKTSQSEVGTGGRSGVLSDSELLARAKLPLPGEKWQVPSQLPKSQPAASNVQRTLSHAPPFLPQYAQNDDWVRKLPPNPLPPNPISVQAKATAGVFGFLTMLMGVVFKASDWLRDHWLTAIVALITSLLLIYLWLTRERRAT